MNVRVWTCGSSCPTGKQLEECCCCCCRGVGLSRLMSSGGLTGRCLARFERYRLCQLFGFCHQYKGHDKMLLRKMELFCILYAVPEGSTSRKVFLASWVYGIGQPVPMDIVLPRCGEIYTKLLCSKSFLQVERHHLEANR